MKVGRAGKIRKIMGIALAALVAAVVVPRLTAIAYGQNTPDAIQDAVQITAAPQNVLPAATIYGMTIGSVIPGDLYYIDSANSTIDFNVNLYITNPDALVHYLRYLVLKVAVYVKDEGGNWVAFHLNGGQPETYLTLQNSPAAFTLAGGAQYKIAVESGCYHCIRAGDSTKNPPPEFYLEAAPL